jgi:hypothetical protein
VCLTRFGKPIGMNFPYCLQLPNVALDNQELSSDDGLELATNVAVQASIRLQQDRPDCDQINSVIDFIEKNKLQFSTIPPAVVLSCTKTVDDSESSNDAIVDGFDKNITALSLKHVSGKHLLDSGPHYSEEDNESTKRAKVALTSLT